jgi:hypothetical protein
MPEIGTSGLMSGDGKRGDGQRPQATAPILDSTPIFRQDEPSRYRDPISLRHHLARSALPRERFRSVAHDVTECSAAKCPELRS